MLNSKYFAFMVCLSLTEILQTQKKDTLELISNKFPTLEPNNILYFSDYQIIHSILFVI